MYLNLFRISLYVLQVKIIFRLKFFNFPCPWLILDFLRLLALIIYQPYKTYTENNSYSIFWTHLIFNSGGHHELSGSDQISQSYFSVVTWLVLSLHAHAAARQSTNSQGFSQVLTLQKMPCSQVLRFSTLFLFRFLLECACSNTDDMALYSIVLLLQPESHAATVRMCKKWLWRGPWFECK